MAGLARKCQAGIETLASIDRVAGALSSIDPDRANAGLGE
jgi:hypothetical protein